MRSQRCSLVATALVVVWACGGVSAGTITTYDDRPSFTAAVGVPLTIEDFTSSDHFPITTGVLNSSTNLVVEVGTPITPGLIDPGVTYSTPIRTDAPAGFFFNIDAGGGFTGGFLDGLGTGAPGSSLTTTFDAPVVGFGFDTNGLMGTAFQLDIHFTSGPDYVQTISNTSDFYGFVSSATDIVSANIYGNSTTFTFALDNFTYPTSAAVPEPSSIVLASIGGLGILTFARRWRQN